MTTQFFKRSLFARVIAFIIIVNFILTSGSIGYCSCALALDSLRTHAANGSRKGADVANELNERIIVTFGEIRKEDVPIAGGKGANLGELQHVPSISVPPGVAITTKAFQLHIDKGLVEVEKEGAKAPMTLREFINYRLKGLNYENSGELASAGEDIRKAIESAQMPQEVEIEIRKWYQQLCDEAGIKDLPVAIRSSATAEDLPDASFAGQQDTYLNIRGIEAVLDAVKRNWASLFTDRAIFYRHEQNIDHATAYISVIIQRMVESYIAGTAFTVHTDTGFPAIAIDGAWGLGEGVVSGAANPDSAVVLKDRNGKLRVYRRTFGKKLQKVVYKPVPEVRAKEGTELVETSYTERHSFALTDERIIVVASASEAIHKHYGRYMDIEWAFDSQGKLWILQARSETPWNKWEKENPDTVKIENTIVPDEITEKAKILVSGVVSARAASGATVILDAKKEGVELGKELDRVKKGNILVTTMTKPDMVPAMKRTGAIVTNEGGPTCHAAIVARELEIPCVVGTGKATEVLKEGNEITVEANKGKGFEGKLEIVELKDNVHIPDLPVTKTKIGIIVASPFLAMKMWGFSKFTSHYGVGLLRKEFADTTEILIHPLAGLAYDMYNDPNFKDEKQKEWIKKNIIENEELRIAIEDNINGYPNFTEFFKDKLANTIALIAAAQTGGQKVIFRTTDFKTNEYRNQIGGTLFEPEENNPMMGYRGINRMLSEAYKRAFKLEIEAVKKARELQKNVVVMFPVVRTPEELKEAVDLFAQHGLVRGQDGFQIYMMVEVPANIFQAEEFYQYVDGMSIGSNDLTQFVLDLGRDNEWMKKFFDEANPAVKKSLEIVIKTAKKMGVTSGLCGQRPSNDPNFAAFLVQVGIDSISVVPEVYKNVVNVVAKQEKELEGKPFDPNIAGWQIPQKDGQPQRIVCAQVEASSIIKNMGIHPQVLLGYQKGEIKDATLRRKIGYQIQGMSVKEYVVDMVYRSIMDKVATTPEGTPIIYVTDDLDKTAYETLLGGKELEPFDENPQLGFCGLARVVDPEYQEFFRWQLEAIKKARQDSGRKNIGIRLNLARILPEVSTALNMIKKAGFIPGQDGFMVGMEIAGPSNVLLINEFIGLGLNFLAENNERFLSYDLAIDLGSQYVQYSEREKENALRIPRLIWTNAAAAEKDGIPLVQFEGEVGITPTPTVPPVVPTITPVVPPTQFGVGTVLITPKEIATGRSDTHYDMGFGNVPFVSNPLSTPKAENIMGIPFLVNFGKSELDGIRVLDRVDWNIPNPQSVSRISASLPGLIHIVKNGGTAIVLTHYGRPGGKVKPELSTKPLADIARRLLAEQGYPDIPVVHLDRSITETGVAEGVKERIVKGAINVLENTRFCLGDEKNDPKYARALAELAGEKGIFVFDGFGAGEREHASVTGVAEYLERIALGPLVVSEENVIKGVLENLYGLIFGGGPKFDEKVEMLRRVVGNIKKGGFLFLGSGPAPAFLKAHPDYKDINLGQKPLEESILGAKEVLEIAKKRGIQVIFPEDFYATTQDLSQKPEGSDKSWLDLKKLPEGAEVFPLTLDELKQGTVEIPSGEVVSTEQIFVYDVGPNTMATMGVFEDAVRRLSQDSSVVWNGDLGVKEIPRFAFGTKHAVTLLSAVSKNKENPKGFNGVVLGADTGASVEQFGDAEKITYVSTGGGAALGLLEDKELTAVVKLAEIQATINTAQALSAKVNEYRGFVSAEKTIYNAFGKEPFREYIYDVNVKLSFAQNYDRNIKEKTWALVIPANFLKTDGATGALSEVVASLNKAVKVALYGEGAEKIRILLGNENIIAEKNFDDVMTKLSQLRILPENILLLGPSPVDKKELKMRQLVTGEMDISTLALAKAIRELLTAIWAPGVETQFDTAFNNFLSKLVSNKIISEQAYNDNRAKLLAKLEAGQTFEFPDLKPMVTKETEEAIETSKKFAEKFI